MPKLTLDLPSTFVERIRRLADGDKELLEDMALLLLRRGYDFVVTVPEVLPDRLVCGRLGNALGDYATASDNRIPDTILGLDWETPATVNDSWSFKLNDHNWKSSNDLIRKLVDIVSKGGNHLLNVGPTAEGTIPQPSIDRLEAKGSWLAVNGEAVYETQAGPVQGRHDLRTTRKNRGVYLHIFDWPRDGEIRFAGLTARKARVLAGGEMLPLRRRNGELVINGPLSAPDAAVTVIELS